MTEAVPRFYGWDIAREEYPDVKVLTNSHSNNGRPAEYQMALFNAYGIADEDIVVIDRPVKVERLVCAAPLFENMRFAHPDLAQTFRRIGSSFEGAGPVRPCGRRIFVSRRPGMWRECVNRDEVEALFIEQGFDVVWPETLTLREQALLFRGCDIVAGYIGSAMYNLMFADRPVKVLGIVGESYVATNEYLINTVVGNPMAIVYGVDIVNGRKKDCDGRLLGSTNLDYRVELSAIQDALRALGEG